jgi:hypothetical protein
LIDFIQASLDLRLASLMPVLEEFGAALLYHPRAGDANISDFNAELQRVVGTHSTDHEIVAERVITEAQAAKRELALAALSVKIAQARRHMELTTSVVSIRGHSMEEKRSDRSKSSHVAIGSRNLSISLSARQNDAGEDMIRSLAVTPEPIEADRSYLFAEGVPNNEEQGVVVPGYLFASDQAGTDSVRMRSSQPFSPPEESSLTFEDRHNDIRAPHESFNVGNSSHEHQRLVPRLPLQPALETIDDTLGLNSNVIENAAQ